jgi:hypothetical protein
MYKIRSNAIKAHKQGMTFYAPIFTTLKKMLSGTVGIFVSNFTQIRRQIWEIHDEIRLRP